MTNDYLIKPLSFEDLDQVARIHILAFPESTLTHFGKKLVKQYYLLNLSESNECFAFGAFSEDKLLGFCFAGGFKDIKARLLRENWLLILFKVITKPQLLFSKKIRRRSLNILKYVKTERKSKQKTKGVASKKKRRFGILSIAVDPESHSKGVGKKLMVQCEFYATAKKFDVMGLTVNVKNYQAIGFYQSLGWVKVVNSEGSWLGRMEKRLVDD